MAGSGGLQPVMLASCLGRISPARNRPSHCCTAGSHATRVTCRRLFVLGSNLADPIEPVLSDARSGQRLSSSKYSFDQALSRDGGAG